MLLYTSLVGLVVVDGWIYNKTCIVSSNLSIVPVYDSAGKAYKLCVLLESFGI